MEIPRTNASGQHEMLPMACPPMQLMAAPPVGESILSLNLTCPTPFILILLGSADPGMDPQQMQGLSDVQHSWPADPALAAIAEMNVMAQLGAHAQNFPGMMGGVSGLGGAPGGVNDHGGQHQQHDDAGLEWQAHHTTVDSDSQQITDSQHIHDLVS